MDYKVADRPRAPLETPATSRALPARELSATAGGVPSPGEAARLSLEVKDKVTLGSTDDGARVGSLLRSSGAARYAAVSGLGTGPESPGESRQGVGAAQGRLAASLKDQERTTANVTTEESRIRSDSFAYESAELSKRQIEQQKGVEALGQANALSQDPVRLIG